MEKLRGSSGKRLLLPHFVLNKASLRTEPSLRWRLPEPEKTLRLGVAQKNLWTQGPNPLKAKEDSSKQVSVLGSQRGEAAVSTSQKGKK
jgi:import inner membrane translocase subunit TIM21